MRHLKLTRVSESKDATYGVLIDQVDKTPFAVTLELPWNGNKSNHSCIPDGFYNCKRHISPKFGETFEVLDVYHRSHILFHKGNIPKNTHGCILLGESFDPVLGELGIINSGGAFKQFMDKLNGEEYFQLEISRGC